MTGPAPVTSARRGATTVASVLGFIAFPAALVLIEAVSHHLRHRSTGFIISSGIEREYLLHVPPSYDATQPTPLVISLHGGALWGAAQRDVSRWNEVADREGFIVAYPSAASHGGPRAWDARPGEAIMTDVRFIADLIDTLKATYNVDSTRIYADGLSNGGGMTFVLSCTLSDRIAAVGLVASAQMLEWEWCTDSRPVPMMAFHGTADPVVPYTGGKTWVVRYTFPSMAAWAAKWARRNRCVQGPAESRVAADVTRIAYTSCAKGADVVLYRVEEGGHTWPGGGPLPEWLGGSTSHSMSASSELWAFYRAHPLVPADGPID